MVLQAMGIKWTSYGVHSSCIAFFVLVLQIHGCLSLNAEGLALFQFRAKVDFDPYGALANWNPDDCDPCMWCGVGCLEGNVVQLNLTGHDLEGVLAPELGNLTHLRSINLSKNCLSGTIPPQFGQLIALEVLDLRDNNLTGTIPAELGGLHSLKRLLLCSNRFEGSIPVEIGKLSLLTDFQFDEILTTAAAGICCVNRKIGHSIWQNVVKQSKKSDSFFRRPIQWTNLLQRFKLGSDLTHDDADDSYSNLTDLPDPGVIREVEKHVNNVRRILVEQSSNLAAIPPKGGAPAPSEPGNSLPSRSSGSFSAIPNGNKLSPISVPSPVPSTPSGHEHMPQDKTNPGSDSRSNDKQSPDNGKSGNSVKLKVIIGVSSAVFLLILVVVLFIIFKSKAAKTIGPWKTGLSGQLQKAFVTGVPKLNRAELETACEDFSNIINTHDGVVTLYKGTLSSGVEIAVASTAIASSNEWSTRSEIAFRKKIDSLSRVNHKNFVNLIGYCEEEEPFTRMMVFEYAPNGSLFEHLHVKELEHIDWNARMRIIMGIAYCLQYMHDLNPPVVHCNLTSKQILLTDDYAAKIADVGFWAELIAKSKAPAENDSEHSELPSLADVETNIQSFGILLLEIVSGKLLHSEVDRNLATQYLNDKTTINQLIDPTLKSFKENELEAICEVIQSCIHPDASKRPLMKEVIQKLKQALDISPEAATPRLSPLWWAELEILSAEAA
ncbi:hypothetical protein BUALT_Bualt03G0044800 [Buddleja alternifolia]|uniref:Protein kinase domain-containing protein n=1 Tax=Buddleja alternifolia TaxID=168488 RepID=A0AAV6Y1V3_9LAMI|nr:hypothetical protein BUALT_Bualt03G0044800 [Buddleja alternifolia]